MSPDHDIHTVDELRALYRRPSGGAVAKELDHLDPHDRAFIAHAPLVMVATSDAEGRGDVSPRGGPPGWVRVLDDGRLVIPDLSGNNRLDTLTNVVANPGIGLLFLIPGLDETLRVNGRALVSTDPALLASADVEGRTPRTVIVVTVDSAYIHCAKAFRRSAAWRPEDWPDRSDLPSIGCMLRDQTQAEGVSADDIDRGLEANYVATLWEPGGAEHA